MFANAQLFRLTAPVAVDSIALESLLEPRRFRPCGPLEMASMGWVPPLGETTSALVHAERGCLLMCARRQERVLPAEALKEALQTRVAEIQDQGGREVGRAERRILREQIADELRPRALTRSRHIGIYVDTVAGWLVVDAAGDTLAEDVVSLLRESLGSLAAIRPVPRHDPIGVMTQWLRFGAPDDFILGDTCELRDDDEVVRCRGVDLGGDEIRGHLKAGKRVTQMGLVWDERLDFTLTAALTLKRIRLTDVRLAEREETDDADPAIRLAADFMLQALPMRTLLGRLEALFGLDDQDLREAA